jgi:hypothetical protein
MTALWSFDRIGETAPIRVIVGLTNTDLSEELQQSFSDRSEIVSVILWSDVIVAPAHIGLMPICAHLSTTELPRDRLRQVLSSGASLRHHVHGAALRRF